VTLMGRFCDREKQSSEVRSQKSAVGGQLTKANIN
jgi:hypothetical protein